MTKKSGGRGAVVATRVDALERWALDLEREWRLLIELAKVRTVPRRMRTRLSALAKDLRELARDAAPWVCHGEVLDVAGPPERRPLK